MKISSRNGLKTLETETLRMMAAEEDEFLEGDCGLEGNARKTDVAGESATEDGGDW